MPELPEVEVLVRQLARRLTGATIRSVDGPDSKIRLPDKLIGACIKGIKRRGKFIVIELDNGRFLLAHLRMTGWFEFSQPKKYRLAIVTNKGIAYFEDPRRLGHIQCVSTVELRETMRHLGPEPFADGFDLAALTKTSRPVKVALLDQRLLAGLGNIYASESLWRARIHPRRKASRLRPAELARLHQAIVLTLRKAIARGDRIFESPNRFAVYERAGQACRRCRTHIRRLIQAQRSTYFCPKCQR